MEKYDISLPGEKLDRPLVDLTSLPEDHPIIVKLRESIKAIEASERPGPNDHLIRITGAAAMEGLEA